MKKRRKVRNVIFSCRDGIFRAFEIDYINRKIGGYKLFPAHSESNPYRTYDLDKCSCVEIK